MKLFFSEKRKRGVLSQIAGSFSTAVLLYFLLILKMEPFFTFKSFFFFELLLFTVFGFAALVDIVENSSFFSVDRRKQEFIKICMLQVTILLAVVFVFYIIFGVVLGPPY